MAPVAILSLEYCALARAQVVRLVSSSLAFVICRQINTAPSTSLERYERIVQLKANRCPKTYEKKKEIKPQTPFPCLNVIRFIQTDVCFITWCQSWINCFHHQGWFWQRVWISVPLKPNPVACVQHTYTQAAGLSALQKRLGHILQSLHQCLHKGLFIQRSLYAGLVVHSEE